VVLSILIRVHNVVTPKEERKNTVKTDKFSFAVNVLILSSRFLVSVLLSMSRSHIERMSYAELYHAEDVMSKFYSLAVKQIYIS
jgi:hypothetical protein